MASQTIDKLQVDIEVTGKNLDSTLKNIESYLSRIESALSKIDVSKLEKANSTISKLNKTVSTTSNNSITPTINTTQIDKASSSIESSLSKLRGEFAGLQSYANAALNGDSSSYTSFQRRIISINSHIDTLQSKLNEVGNIQVPSSEWTDLQSKISEATNTLSDLKTQEEEYRNTHPGYEKEADYQNIVTAIQAAETEVQNLKDAESDLIANGGATSSFSSTSTFANYQSQLSTLRDTVSNTSNTVTTAFNQMNSKTLSIDTSDVVSGLKNVATNAKNAATKLWEMTKTGITSGINGVKSVISSLSSRIKNLSSSVSSVNSGFSKGFTTVLKYGFGIRSLYVLFRRLRTAITDSFTELQTSGAFFETTNANVDALSDSLTTLKYQFGAAFEPIFNTVAPALQTLINYLVSVMNTISAFIAKLTGASTYSKAVVATAEIADNTGSAADSASDLNKQLQGFDELNNLSGDSGSGSGGSGSSSSDDSTITYVEESVESSLTSFWSTLADYIADGDWYMVGDTISNALTSAMNNIPWNTVFSAASDFGTNLAEFLNGLISDDLFTALGTTIANSIKTALYAKLSFSETFDWTGLGTAVASGINAFVSSNVLQLSVTTFNSWANGILTTLIAAVQNISWSSLSSTIAESIGTLDASDIMGKLGTLANSIANALYTLVSNKDTWSNLGTKIGEGITAFFTSMNATDSKTGKTGWQALASTITNTIGGLADTIITALETTDWEEVGKGIADFISEIDWKAAWFKFTTLLSALKEAIVDIIKGMNLSDADVAGISVGIGAIALTLLTISGLSLAASITKKVITDLIVNAIMAKLGTSAGAAVSIGSIGSVIGQVGLTIGVAVVGWKIGTLAYENATGKEAPSFGEIVSTLASDGAFGDLVNGIKLDLEGDASITWDLVSTLSSLTGNNASLAVSQLNVSTKKVKVDVDTSTTDSAMTFTNQLSLDTLLGGDFSEYGADIVQGVQQGAQDEINNNSGSTWTGMWNQFKALVGAGIMGVFGIHSPATAMEPYGENILLGILEGFKNKMSDFSSVISTLKDNIVSWLQQKFSNFSLSNYISGWGDITATVSAKLKTPINTLKSWGTSFVNNITNKWTDITSTVKAVLGGDLKESGINTFSSWSTIFENFKSSWTGASATFRAKLGGGISKITDLSTWQTTFSNLYNTWNSKDASFTAGYGAGTSERSIGTMKSKITELTGAWFGKSATFAASYASGTSENSIGNMKNAICGLTGSWVSKTATFAATLANGTTTEKLGNYKSAIDSLVSSWKSPSSRAYFQADFDESLSTLQSFAEAIKTIYDNWKGRNAEFTMSASVDSGDIDEIATKLTNKIKNKLSGTVSMSFKANALGGILTSAGWKSIPQYASGSLNTGSLFFAGEKSGNPELVGHVNGRTEVLNKSQLASVMYASVGQAMRNFGSLASPPTLTANGYSASGVSGAKGVSNSDALMMAQNRLLERQNMLLEQIANKDNTVSVSDIFGAMQSANNDYYNRTGNSAFVF